MNDEELFEIFPTKFKPLSKSSSALLLQVPWIDA